MNTIKLNMLLQDFFNEDFGDGDLTSESIFLPNDHTSGTYTVKSSGIISGLHVVQQGYRLINPEIVITMHVNEGDFVDAGTDIITVQGPVRDLLTAERVLLNLLQRMSGIATMTHRAVQKLQGSKTRICDTRKTTPGLRMLEKYAVTCGGGFNHRTGLYDTVMLKDNHIAYSGSITQAVEKVRAKLGHTVKIEVETTCLDEVQEAAKANADIIMFDNCTPDEIRKFIQYVPSHIITEASGGIDLSTLEEYGKTGVDYISLGFLTHSYKAMDISFNIQPIEAIQKV
ncbi:carboxylating nicotinate-nucleotide diphosphorylase [Terrilactibacillus sp. BCM23-1]|uniref:Probable nicotinate-nucleotide pyrophosphorylase [carboxylating] n=1 Tax=Terrilactibacillus tamarindi TaxID=2599694 RepID=A0A6N8CNI9_9BACI|nr:carboxylating nicotinate-nucleotide diphosphorylase [Terrilactibacillus tamarindi]MTT30673.1 carboxylating nicotinate-nucleotide diphosphorylase [Terrilactibacillus tamarindi]